MWLRLPKDILWNFCPLCTYLLRILYSCFSHSCLIIIIIILFFSCMLTYVYASWNFPFQFLENIVILLADLFYNFLSLVSPVFRIGKKEYVKCSNTWNMRFILSGISDLFSPCWTISFIVGNISFKFYFQYLQTLKVRRWVMALEQ